jgi:DNA-binding NtrC family response regulator
LNSGRPVAKVDLPSSMTGVLPKLSNIAAENRIIPLCEIEKQTIRSAIAALAGDKLMAAKLLGIGKTTLYRKLKEYGVEA